MISHEEALIYTMVLVSAADSEMSDAELRTIGELVNSMPVFKGFDAERVIAPSHTVRHGSPPGHRGAGLLRALVVVWVIIIAQWVLLWPATP